MTTYSTLFYAGGVTTAQTHVFTVPAAELVVLRDVEVRNTGSGPDDFVIGWTGTPGLAGYYFPAGAVPATQSHQWQGRVVVPAGAVISCNANFGSFEVVISGYLFTNA